MKLIALKDFANNFGLEVEDHIHPGLVHKGYEFEIGTAAELKKLSAAEKMLVAQLIVAGCVGDATDAKVVKAVREEIALEKRREQNFAKLNAAADGSSLMTQLTALLKKANANTTATASGATGSPAPAQ